MTTTNQVVLSIVVVAAAVSVVALRLRSEGPDGASAPDEGHDHAAMAVGGGAMQPVVLDAEAARRIGISMTTVERRDLPSVLRTVGTVAYDETRLASVSPKIEGWVERLLIDFTGAPVASGEPLLEVYSPALVTAQEELVLAARLVRETEVGRARENATQLLAAARRRLSYWDISADDISRIEESGVTQRTLTLRSPASGVIVEKNVVQGDRIVPGMTVYRIADLLHIWVEVEVFEKDLALVAEGQRAVASFEAYPGRDFEGVITYVHPTVSVQSRTARARVELPNPALELKPGMYADVELHSKPRPATLVVPRDAVIGTGERTLVFVESADGALLPTEVVQGRTSGRFVEILEGLTLGDRIVSSAAFLVDAESNLGTMTGATDLVPEVPETAPDEMDHSEHNAGGMDAAPDTVSDSRGPDRHER
jgi:membrane fusion protein, copper/silver efflux system